MAWNEIARGFVYANMQVPYLSSKPLRIINSILVNQKESCSITIYKICCSCDRPNFSNEMVRTVFRSSHRWCSIKQSVLKNVAKFTGKYLCWGLSSNSCNYRPAVIKLKTEWIEFITVGWHLQLSGDSCKCRP